MPKLPDPKSDSARLVLIPKKGWEHECRALKEIARRNNEHVSDILYEYAVKGYLRDHNWPPGNSQTVLATFSGKPTENVLCEVNTQHGIAVAVVEHRKSGHLVFVCQHCLENYLDSKKWRQL